MKARAALLFAFVTFVVIEPTLSQLTPILPGPKIPEAVSRTLLLHSVPPVYPSDAKRDCIEGNVVLALTIGETGTVQHVSVLSGPSRLANSAIAAARQWVYEPYLLDHKPVPYNTQATVPFRLPHDRCHGTT